jgi:hypothetical protein
MDQEPVTNQHSFEKSIVLHLLPGALIGLCYFLLVGPAHRLGYPSIAALMVAVAIVLVPAELGYLLYQGRKKNGRVGLQGIIGYRTAIPAWQYFVWIPIVFVVIGLIFTLMKPVDRFLQLNLFGWMPRMESGLEGGYARGPLIVTYLLVFILGAIVGPTVEELYFRGYLLPRMRYAGRWAPVLHSLLFALYHVFTPWMFVTRTVGLLPLVYAVKKRNLYIGIAVHIMVNLIDVVMGVIFILSM